MTIALIPSAALARPAGGGASGADLTITKSDSPDPVEVGHDLTYTIVARNKGPAKATGVRVNDPLPASVTSKSVATTKGSCSGSSALTCTIGTLAKKESATITIVVVPNSAGTVTNAASVSGDQSDPTSGNNSASATTTVTAPPSSSGWTLTLTDSPDPVTAGDRLTFLATWRNGTNLTRDKVALGLNWFGQGSRVLVESASGTRGFCLASPFGDSASAACMLGRVAPGDEGTMTVVVRAVPALDRQGFTLSTPAELSRSGCNFGDPQQDPVSFLGDVLFGGICIPEPDIYAKAAVQTRVDPL